MQGSPGHQAHSPNARNGGHAGARSNGASPNANGQSETQGDAEVSLFSERYSCTIFKT